MGSEKSTSDEWIEFTVTGPSSVDVSGWTLTSLKSDGSNPVVVRFLTGTVLLPGSHVVSNFSAEQSAIAVTPVLVTSSLTLPNTKLQLQLFNASGQLMDEADDGVGDPMAGSNVSGQPKATMQRVDFLASGRAPTNWKTSDFSMGFDDGSPMLGSPGSGEELPVPVSSSSLSSSSAMEESSSNEATSSSLQSFSSISSESSAISVTSPFHIWVSEVLPNPVGSDDQEWVELAADGVALLDGLSLSDGTRTFALNGKTLDGVLLLPKSVTGLSFSNAGGEVRLMRAGELVDVLSYDTALDGVSIGILDGEDRRFCLPTPAEPNRNILPELEIRLQSGQLSGEGKVTFNVEVVAARGTLQGAECSVDFGDGDFHDGCNPPSHTIDRTGDYTLTAEVQDICGNTVSQLVSIRVTGETDDHSASSVASKGGQATTAPKASRDDVVLLSVLPNPQGDDRTSGEYITLVSTADVPVSLRGFFLVAGKTTLPLDEVVLEPGVELRLGLKAYGASLTNTEGSVVLLFGKETHTSISWKDAREGMEYKPAPSEGHIAARVLRVIDGDTVEVVRADGKQETVRLRGIDAPERASFFREKQEYSDESTDYLRTLLKGKNSELQFDTEYQDAYGRTLAYLHTEDALDVQLALLERGLAKVIPKVNFTRRPEYEEAQAAAQNSRVGIWSHLPLPTSDVADPYLSAPIETDNVREGHGVQSVIITEIFPSPAKEEQEWIELQNVSEEDIDLTGWTLTEDASGSRRRWSIPPELLLSGGRFVVRASGSLQLNNGGQTVTLRDGFSSARDEVTYPKIASGKSYAKTLDGWCVAKPTPGEEVVCETPKKASTKKTSATVASVVAGLPAYLSTIYVSDEDDALPEEETETASGTALQLEELQTQEWHDHIPPVRSNILALMTMMFLGVVCGTGSIFLYRKASLRIAEMVKF